MEKVRRRNQGMRVPEGSLDNTGQVIPTGGCVGGFMFLQQAKTGTDDLGFIVEPPTGNKSVNQLLEMWRNDFAHAGNIFR